MTAKLHYGARTPTTATASTAAAGYAATNVLTPQVRRSWRSTTTGAEWVQVDLGASLAVTAIGFTGVNFASCTVKADNAATPTTVRGTPSTGFDNGGRYKGSLEFSASVRYLRLEIAGGTPINGAAFWEVGAIHVFASTLALPRDPLYGAQLSMVQPQAVPPLGNGSIVRVDRGPSWQRIELPFAARAGDDVEQAHRLAAIATCWLDLGIVGDIGKQWPVRSVEERVVRRLDRFNRETVTLPLNELA